MSEGLTDFVDRVVPEINHLFWTPVFRNRGILDWGWSCREHAWATTILLRDVGVDCMAAHGRVQFVFPQADDLSAPFFFDVQLHSFVRVIDDGYLDMSIKPRPGAEHGSLLEFPRMRGSQLVPKEWGALELADVGKALPRLDAEDCRDQRVVRYKVDRLEEPTRTMVNDPVRWINSPLTDELTPLYGRVVYSRALAHLKAYAQRETESLQAYSRRAAWDRICNHKAT